MPGGPSIPQVLVESLRARLRGSREGSTLELAVQAAVSPDLERRAWMLAALATRLRREHETDLARLAIDGAVAIDADAAATRGHDPYLLRTMARVYWGLWRQTKDEAWHDRWWRVHVQLNESAVSAAA